MNRERVLRIEVFESENGDIQIWREWSDGSFEGGLANPETEEAIKDMIRRRYGERRSITQGE